MNFKIEVVLSSVFVVMMGVLSGIPAAEAQMTIGGHVGFVLPLATHAAGQTTTIADNFSIGFPLGVTFKGNGHVAYDLELVPGVRGTPRLTTLTVHPGLVWDVGNNLGAGIRAAFDVNSPQWGFTPLVNRSWPLMIACSRRSSSRLSYRSASTGPRMDRRRILSASVHTLEWRSEMTLSQSVPQVRAGYRASRKCQLSDGCCTMSNALGTITEPPNVKLVNRSLGNLVVETSTLHIAQQAI